MPKKKNPTKKVSPASTRTPRQIKPPTYSSFRLSPRIKHPDPPLPSALKLFSRGLGHIFQYKKIFLGIALVYLLLALVFVKGAGLRADASQLKELITSAAGSERVDIATGTELFGFLIEGSAKSKDATASTYQLLFLLIMSLAIIWALRQTYAKKKITIRDCFYKGMHPLVPFLGVVLVIGLQLLPFMLGSGIYGTIVNNDLAVTFIEKAMWFLMFALSLLLSLYMVSSSLFALYIVTLTGVPPMNALRSARQLVRYRRWSVMRKVLLLPVMLLVLAGVLVVPLIIFATPVAPWVFFALSTCALPIVHSYMYGLYRELL